MSKNWDECVDDCENEASMKNYQLLIEKYTQMVMKRLYNQDVQVFFSHLPDGVKAIYRPKGSPSPSIEIKMAKESEVSIGLASLFDDKEITPMKEIDGWDRKKCNITFCIEIFRNEGEHPPISNSWSTIVHEVTHHEIGVYSAYVGGQIRHSKEFKDALKRNLKKVKDLRKDFKDELEAVKCQD